MRTRTFNFTNQCTHCARFMDHVNALFEHDYDDDELIITLTKVCNHRDCSRFGIQTQTEHSATELKAACKTVDDKKDDTVN